MAKSVEMEISEVDVRNLLQSLDPALVRKAIRSALDRTVTWAKNYIANDVTSNYVISASRVKQAMTTRRSTQNNLSASINVRSNSLSVLDDFNGIQDNIGILANISRFSPFRVAHAFINVARNSGKRVIMMRVGNTPYRRSRKRGGYPTTGKPGCAPSVTTLVNRRGGREQRDAAMLNHFYLELETQIANRTKQPMSIAEVE